MRNLSLILCLGIFLTSDAFSGQCKGRFINPIKDVCWSCMFPISIGGAKLNKQRKIPDTPNPSNPICMCGSPIPRVGIAIGFWEPIAIVDVVREPYCLLSLGGIKIANSRVKGGHWANHGRGMEGNRTSFYHVHWVKFPVFVLMDLFKTLACLEKGDMDVAYMSELDPLWNDDELAAMLTPDNSVFANPLAQAACAADCISSSHSLPMDKLYWCQGCQGNLMPFVGSSLHHSGAVNTSLLMAGRLLGKMHRFMMLPETAGTSAKVLCEKPLNPIIKKSQYRLQMSSPKANQHCYAPGHTEIPWSSGKEIPMKGEDFAYVIWRKRNCCMS